MYNVYCVKWGDKYNRDFVTRLKDSVESNTTLDIKFWCYTDQPESEYDIPVKYPYLRGVWHKLALFDFVGLNIFFDLDVEIKKNIDFLFTDFQELTLIDSSRWKSKRSFDKDIFRFRLYNDSRINSSFMRWNDCSFIFKYFLSNQDTHLRLYGGIDRFIYNENIPYKLLKDTYVASWQQEKWINEAPIFLWNQRFKIL
jgi:hypothetical protein